MSLVDAVSRVFQAGGLLAKCLPGHVARSGQTKMALEVASTIETGGLLVVEAETGVGKTFAYLVPALLCGQRVMVSTATKALQDQLFQQDLPKLKSMLGVPVRIVQLKGRSSYLCQYRLEHARQDAVFNDDHHLQQLAAVESWALTTSTGDLAEVAALHDQSSVVPLVSSTRENCLGGRCPQASVCHVNSARRNAMAADLVVVNHHLFFADLNVRESGVAELLPTVSCVVFDEAHQINDIGVQFMGTQFSTQQLESFATEILITTTASARGFADWQGLTTDLRRAADGWRSSFGRSHRRISWIGASPQGIDAESWFDGVEDVSRALDAIAQSLMVVREISPELDALFERSQRLLSGISLFQVPCDSTSVRWLEVGNAIRLYQAPIDIAKTMQNQVLRQFQEPGNSKSWIFTSATLGHDASLRWFVESCGLQDAKIVKIESPFNYVEQAALYVPLDIPLPSNFHHASAVAKLAAEGAVTLGGRTMVLTTSLKAMQQIGAELRSNLAAWGSGLEVWIQGEAPKREILRKMTSQQPGGGCVVVASVSFWEGVDLPGAALQLLLMDKLPFSPPDDPVQESRAQRLESEGRNAFRDLHLPLAAIALKQGAGRLIRRETDSGVLVVCDTRLVTKGYGKKLLSALPPMRRLTTEADYLAAVLALTKPSTKDLD